MQKNIKEGGGKIGDIGREKEINKPTEKNCKRETNKIKDWEGETIKRSTLCLGHERKSSLVVHGVAHPGDRSPHPSCACGKQQT